MKVAKDGGAILADDGGKRWLMMIRLNDGW